MFAKALLFGALAVAVSAQESSKVLFFTNVPNPITDGKAAAITYSTNDTQSPVTITLRQGNPSNLQTVEVLTSSNHGSQFIWTPPKSLPNGNDYALQINQGTQVNYFGPFTIQGASPSAVSKASASTASTSSSNGTTTGGHTASMGTGTAMPRNTTMQHHHTVTSQKTTSTKTKATKPPTNIASTSSGAAFQPTNTGNNSPTPTGGASSDFTTGSSLALAFGAIAAILCLS